MNITFFAFFGGLGTIWHSIKSNSTIPMAYGIPFNSLQTTTFLQFFMVKIPFQSHSTTCFRLRMPQISEKIHQMVDKSQKDIERLQQFHRFSTRFMVVFPCFPMFFFPEVRGPGGQRGQVLGRSDVGFSYRALCFSIWGSTSQHRFIDGDFIDWNNVGKTIMDIGFNHQP